MMKNTFKQTIILWLYFRAVLLIFMHTNRLQTESHLETDFSLTDKHLGSSQILKKQKNLSKALIDRKVVPNLIELMFHDIAEDGNVVPIRFSINCSMSNKDYPKRVHVLGLENPFPEIAIYEFFLKLEGLKYLSDVG